MSTIHLNISKEDSVKRMQEKFSRLFPFLKINFFKTRGDRRIFDQSALFCPDVKLTEVNKDLHEGEFEITDATTISEFENIFFEKFGLPVQISRRSGNIWMQTSMTDGLTLKEQNEHGKEISPEPVGNICFKQVPFGC